MSREELRNKVDLALLSDFYGGLLTEKQRRVLSLYCEEDYSLGEISAEAGISRQAVHETISRAAGRLREMEEALGTAARFQRVQNGLRPSLAALREQDYSRAQSLLEELMELE